MNLDISLLNKKLKNENLYELLIGDEKSNKVCDTELCLIECVSFYKNYIINHPKENITIKESSFFIWSYLNELCEFAKENNINIPNFVCINNINDYKGMSNDKKYKRIIINPPYSGSLHLDFFENALSNLSPDGELTIIEPATWLINVRKNGKAKRYNELKNKIEGHIKSVTIENLNKEFVTQLFSPFSITIIDMGKTYDTIDYNICGEHKVVHSIYDCNLIGDYVTIWSILNKVHSYKDMMNNHITKEDKGRNYWYCKYADVLGCDSIGCGAFTIRSGMSYDGETIWDSTNKKHMRGYYSSAYHYTFNEISNYPICKLDSGKHLTDKIASNIYGTKTELENWKYFIFNNKLPLFINIIMTIDQNNNSKEYLPWLVDKQYTDEEINKKFNFTKEEINLIEKTIEKFERNSPWFKRYMCGSESVSDKEVQDFMEKLEEKYA